MSEERLRRVRLQADAGPLRDSVLAAVRGARREQRLWRWTWAAAALVLAIAIPVNLAADSIGAAAASSVARKPSGLPPGLEALVRVPLRSSPKPHLMPRSVEDLR
jgi:hypothetical protein